MAVRRCEASIDVVKAARQRILNVFRNGLPVYLSFSGGKDSLCLAYITLELIQQGQIDAGQLYVQFVDEEAIFPCIERTVLDWRKKFLLSGAKFSWYCVEVRHFNCFNELFNDESFICWDSTKEAVWVRRPPTFAVRDNPLLRPRIDSYQEWLERQCTDGIVMVGVRTAESVQRLKNIVASNTAGKRITNSRQIFPIYDWTDNDVWLYLLNNNVEIPDVYLYLWQAGLSKRNLRVSQFFSVDTARSLVKMNEYYPDLMEQIIRREPNAYLAALYWDSEMFGRNSGTRRRLEDATERDYKAELIALFNTMDQWATTKHKRFIADKYRKYFLQIAGIATDAEYKRIYEGLISGDPKARTLRAIYSQIRRRYVDDARKESGVSPA